ncbi:MAG: hypothetical protein R8G66_33020 [Cytophagales bacterium]|nr:hypothetical protein [Cytophagales bacterium]
MSVLKVPYLAVKSELVAGSFWTFTAKAWILNQSSVNRTNWLVLVVNVLVGAKEIELDMIYL